MSKKRVIKSEGQILHLDENGQVVKVEYEDTPQGQEAKNFDQLTTWADTLSTNPNYQKPE